MMIDINSPQLTTTNSKPAVQSLRWALPTLLQSQRQSEARKPGWASVDHDHTPLRHPNRQCKKISKADRPRPRAAAWTFDVDHTTVTPPSPANPF